MGAFDFQELLSAFIVLFAVIDIFGAIPIYFRSEAEGKDGQRYSCYAYRFCVVAGFFFAGDMMLRLFQVDYSFVCGGRCFRYFLDVA